MAPSHSINECWLIINMASTLYQLHICNASDIKYWKMLENFICNMTVEKNPWHPMTSHGCQDVSNHQHTTVQKLFQRDNRKNKISLYLDWPLYPGNPPNPQVTGGFPHKWPVMLKAFPSHDVTMVFFRFRLGAPVWGYQYDAWKAATPNMADPLVLHHPHPAGGKYKDKIKFI